MSDPDKQSTGKPAPVSSYAMDAMAEDLGNARLEDLATDETDHNSRPARPRPQLPTPQQNNVPLSAAAQSFRDAIQNGEFRDDDYHGVQGLDPIAGGNLHRENRLGVQNGHNPFQGGPRLINQVRTIKRLYNAENPTYRGQHKMIIQNDRPSPLGNHRQAQVINSNPRALSLEGHRQDQVSKPGPHDSSFGDDARPKDPKSNIRISSLGGVIPDGATVKRYEPTKKVAEPKHAESNGANGASGSGSSTTKQPVRTQNGRVGDASARQQPKDNGASVRPKHEQLFDHLTNGKPFNEPMQGTVSRSSGAAAAAQPKQKAAVTKGRPRDQAAATQPKHNAAVNNGHPKGQAIVAQPKQNGAVTNSHHRGQAATAQPKQTATVTNGHHKDQVAMSAAPAKGKQQTTPLQAWPSITAMGGRKIFFEHNLNVKTFENSKRMSTPGKISIYEVAGKPVTVWELITDQKEVIIRKDIRELTRWFQTLKTSTICYPEGPKGAMQAHDLEFEDLETARELVKVIKDQKELRAQSTEPRFEQVHSPQPGFKKAQSPQPTFEQLKVQPQEPNREQVQSPQPTFEHFRVQLPEPQDHPPTYAEEQGSVTSEDLMEFGEEPPSPEALEKESSSSQTLPDTLIDFSDVPEVAMTTIKPVVTSNYLDELRIVFDLFEKQRADDKELETAFLDMEATSFACLSEHMSQDALEFIYGLSKDTYGAMIQKDNSMNRPNEPADSSPGQARHSSVPTFKIVWNHLKQDDAYRRLTSDDQKLAQSVVYATVLHGHGRIIRSRRSILNLKPRGAPQPCPDEIRELNALVKSGKEESRRPTPTYTRLPADASLQGWQNFASSSGSSQESPDLKVAQHHNPAPRVEGSTNTGNLKAKEVTSSTWNDFFDSGEAEVPVREPSAWDLIDFDEPVEPKTHSRTSSWATTSSESTADGQEKPARTLRDSQWAMPSRSEHSPDTSFRLDRTFSGGSDARLELSQAPRSSSHVRNNTETSNKSDMSMLANKMGSAPSKCPQS